ncbi:hypothetical protein MUO83_09230 [Candidatus Bathyarchaeota archaeon]|nr:hypothetical protein [Candidatus Bathyarchaeota archaeon]
MDSRTVRYGRIGEVVVLIFPDEFGSKHFITQIETKNILAKMGMEKMPVQGVNQKIAQPNLIARVVA